MELEEIRECAQRMRGQIGRVVLGHKNPVTLLFVALLAEGHVLLEGVPGTAKTLLARMFARCLSLDSNRIQFTPDLMPGDVTGTNLFDFRTSEFVLTRGPVFTQVLLADEINRTPPKTQAALLEAMQERSVTIDGTTHDLGRGFMVIATQNPIEQEGTYPLPEAQLDRFLLKVKMGYPSLEEEREMAATHGHMSSSPKLENMGIEPLVDLGFIEQARELVASLRVSDEVLDYIVGIVRATRDSPALIAGASPRATNMLTATTRAYAALHGRDYAIPDDVKTLTPYVLAHRLVLSPGAEIEGSTTDGVLREILQSIQAPR